MIYSRFTKIEVNDEGEYTCTARNDAGSASASSVIKVQSTPVITITPDNYVQVYTGDAINVECRANGYPEPMVSIGSKHFLPSLHFYISTFLDGSYVIKFCLLFLIERRSSALIFNDNLNS